MSDPTLTCPKCGHEMRKLDLEGCIIDRCENCFGIWLDEGERLKVISRRKHADVIDIGPEEIGSLENRKTLIDCPRCGVPMEHKLHPDQKHIGFEECPQCKGSFFDAGELRDLSRFSLGDLISVFTRRRKEPGSPP